MDGAYPHVLINHFPIVLSLLGLSAAVVALATRRRTVWLYAMATMALAGVASVPTFLTGEPAEHAIGKQFWVSRRAIHEHEEAGEWAFYATLLAGALGAYGWYRVARTRAAVDASGTAVDGSAVPTWLAAAVVATAALSAATMAKAGYESGFIRHKAPVLESETIPTEQQLPRATEPRRGPPPGEGGAPAAPTTATPQ